MELKDILRDILKREYEYIAEIPRDVHGHHIFVYVTAKGQQRYL